MPLDASIINGYRPIKLDDPQDIEAKQLSLRKMRGDISRSDREDQANQTLSDLYRSTNGDPKATIAGLASAGFPEKAWQVQEQSTKAEAGQVGLDTNKLTLASKRFAEMGQGFFSLSQKPNVTQQDVLGLLSEHLQSGLIDPDTASKAAQTIPTDPTQLKDWLHDHAMRATDAAKQVDIQLKTAPKPVAPIDLGGTKEVGGTTNPLTGQLTRGTQVKMTQTPESIASQAGMDRRAQMSAGAGGGDLFGDEEKRAAAFTVMSDPARMRDYATFGKVGQLRRDQINHEQEVVKKETGMTTQDVIRLRARAKAQTKNLDLLQKQSAQTQAAEDLAKFNGKRVLELLDLVDDTGIPMIEGFTRSAKRAAGGVDAAELKSVLTAFQTEVARILSGNPSMAGVISDTARHEIATMSPDSMNTKQGRRVIMRLFAEMGIRNAAIQNQMDQAIDKTTVGGPAAPAAAPAAQETKVIGGKTYTKIDGVWHE